MSLYVDSSCLLKLALDEPESPRVRSLLAAEEGIAVSTLAALEAQSVLLAMKLGGEISPRHHARLAAGLTALLSKPPFALHALPATACALAIQQLATGPYCRTLDRLHLAAMAAAHLRRLLTNDDTQAIAARALGFSVVQPR